MKAIIDLIAMAGGCMIAGGVYLEFGDGYALIASGALCIALALKVASVHGGTDAADSE